MFNDNGINHTLGEFKVRIGPMGSGKTSRVISSAFNNEKRFIDTGKKKSIRILMVRPSQDQRISDPHIFTTHGNHLSYDVREHQNVSVVVIKTGFEHELIIKYNQYDLYIFDEGQFFDQKIAQYLSELVFMGKRIYFTALLHDFKDEVFPTTLAVMTLPEVSNIKKLYNQCSICGKDGLHSARMYQGKIVSAGPQVLIGDMGSSEKEYTYIGICTYCKKQALGKI